MSQERYAAVDAFIHEHLVPKAEDDAWVLEESERAGLPPHHVAPNQGKLLALLVRVTRARAILELGTLGGYSTLWLARGVGPAGRVTTLEHDEVHASVARRNFERAGLADRIELHQGDALKAMDGFVAFDRRFDFFFFDADKARSVSYFQRALALARPGALLVCDNVVRAGAVADREAVDASSVGVRALFASVGGEPRAFATALQTVGEKGHDGFLVAQLNGTGAERD